MTEYSEAFHACDARTSRWEGGNVDDRDDPGGRTSRGVTQTTFAAYCRKAGKPVRDVFSMTEAERLEIYHSGYWQPVRGDELPAGVNLVTYDAGVNSGPSRSGKWTQLAINRVAGMQLVTVDGVIGPMTVAGARRVSASAVVKQAVANRNGFLNSLSHFRKYGRGWMNRTADIEATALSWALVPVNGSVAPALHEEARAAQAGQQRANRQGGVASGAGAGTVGGGSLLDLPAGILVVAGALIAAVVAVTVVRALRERARADAFLKAAEGAEA